MRLLKPLFICLSILLLSYSTGYSQCPRRFNQFDVELRIAQSQIVITGVACDVCRWGPLGVSVCNCRNACRLTEEQEAEVAECRDRCEDNYAHDLLNLEYCLDACDVEEEAYLVSCREDCGMVVEPSKSVTQWRFRVDLWYNTGFYEDFTGDPEVTRVIEQDGSLPGNKLVINLLHEFPDEPISYCYITQATLLYNDGSCCHYVDFDCVLIG
ncbi:MAG: hypothetical protein AAFP19_18730 [Bacteroidota bacterium]